MLTGFSMIKKCINLKLRLKKKVILKKIEKLYLWLP